MLCRLITAIYLQMGYAFPIFLFLNVEHIIIKQVVFNLMKSLTVVCLQLGEVRAMTNSFKTQFQGRIPQLPWVLGINGLGKGARGWGVPCVGGDYELQHHGSTLLRKFRTKKFGEKNIQSQILFWCKLLQLHWLWRSQEGLCVLKTCICIAREFLLLGFLTVKHQGSNTP